MESFLSRLVTTLEKASEDNRRTIWEYNSTDDSVQRFIIHDQLPVGNHFHQYKEEIFLFLSGGGTVRLCAMDAFGNTMSEIVSLQVTTDSVVRVPPYMAHVFELEPGTTMVCYNSAPFDPDDNVPVDLFKK